MGALKDFQPRFSPAILKKVQTMQAALSFETGEQGEYRFYAPERLEVLKIRSIVQKALAATDSGTVTLKNNAGTAMATGVVTHAASAAVGNEQNATPTTNTTIAKGDHFRVTPAKTTGGGKVLVTVEYRFVRAANL